MSRQNISAYPVKAQNTISSRKPMDRYSKPERPPPYEQQVPSRKYVRDPKYVRTGIELVEVVGKLRPAPRFVVKKAKRRKSRRRAAPSLPTHSAATMAYVRRVRETFWERPEVYNEFVAIMAEMSRDPGANMLELIERVVLLFDGYPDLIFSFDAFLPERYELELQDDAVVVKVYDDWETLEDDDTLEEGEDSEEGGDGVPPPPSSSRETRNRKNIDETVEYLRGVKKTFRHKAEIYKDFTDILHSYHTRTSDELLTIRKVVRLFRGYPNLVLGFNEFLPKGFGIHMYDTSKYTIEYKDEDGVASTAHIGLQAA